MSFHFTSSAASLTFENSSPIAARVSRSPSFSSLWISRRWGKLGKSFQLVQRRGDLETRFRQVFPHLLGRIRNSLDPIKVDLVAGLFRQVDNVVQAGRQQKDVLLVEWRYEGAVDQVVNLMSSLVAFVFEVNQPGVAASALQERLAQLGERLADQVSLLPKQLEEPLTSR